MENPKTGLGLFGAIQKRWQVLRSAWMQDTIYLREYFWKYRKLAYIGLAALVTVDLLEILPPIYLKWAIDKVTSQAPYEQLLTIAGLYFFTACLQTVGRFIWRMYLVRASMFAGRDLRNRFVGHLYGLSPHFFEVNRVGDLMSHSTTDVEAVRMMLGPGLLVLADAIFYLTTVPIAMLWLSPKLTLLALAPLVFVPWVVIRIERMMHKRYQAVQESFARLSSLVQEGLSGIRIIKGFSEEKSQFDRVKGESKSLVTKTLALTRVQSAMGPSLDFLMSVALILLLFIGGKMVMLGGVTLGTFVAFQRYIQKMIWPMTSVGLAVSHYQKAVTSSERIKLILDQKSELLDSTVDSSHSVLSEATLLRGKTKGRLEFKNLSFGFSPDKLLLKEVTGEIEAGNRVGFVGSIGSGKSLFLSLIPRIYAAPKGTVFFDGIPVEKWPLDELRRQIGFVSQDVFLFSETVFENLGYGLIDPELGSEIGIESGWHYRVTELAGIKEEIEKMSFRFDTRLGERGVNLSGGQKQRLTLARALARDPSVLILDDAFSSVDSQTERKILTTLAGRKPRCTELLAAHRISTLSGCDAIWVFEQGRIVQKGTHTELIRQGGWYAKFYQHQMLNDELEAYANQL